MNPFFQIPLRTPRWLFAAFGSFLFAFLLLFVFAPASSFASTPRADITPTPTATPLALTEIERLKNELQTSEARRLAAQSRLVRSDDLELSLLLAAEGFKRADNDESRSALLTDLETQLAFTIRYPQPNVGAVAVSDSANLIAAAGRDKKIYRWNLPDGTPRGEPLVGENARIHVLALSADAKTLAAGYPDGSIWLWDMVSGKPIGDPLKGHTKVVSSLVFSPDGKMLVSGSADKTILKWDISSALAKPIGAPLSAKDMVEDLLFTPDGKQLISHDGQGAILVWDAANGTRITELGTGGSDLVTSLAIRPDGARLAIGNSSGAVQIWDLVNHKSLFEIKNAPEGEFAYALAYNPDGKLLAEAYSDGVIHLLDADTGEEYKTPLTGIKTLTSGLAFVQGGNVLASWGDDDTMRFWTIVHDEAWRAPLGLASRASNDVRFSPNGVYLAAAKCTDPSYGASCFGTTIVLWDVAGRKLAVPPLGENKSDFGVFAFSADSTQLALNNCKQFEESKRCSDNEIRVWNLSTGKWIGTPMELASAEARSIAFAPNGTALAVADSSNAIQLWDIASGKPIGSPLLGHTDLIASLRYSPDGKQLASASVDKTVRLWDVASTGLGNKILAGHTAAVKDVVFSADGTKIASAGEDKTVRVWDADTGMMLGAPFALDAPAVNVAFSPDGALLAAGDDRSDVWLENIEHDAPPVLVDAESGNQITHSVESLFYALATVTFSPDGNQMWTVTREGVVRKFTLSELLKPLPVKVCDIVQRNLSRQEWTQYISDGIETFDAYQKNPTCPDSPVEK